MFRLWVQLVFVVMLFLSPFVSALALAQVTPTPYKPQTLQAASRAGTTGTSGYFHDPAWVKNRPEPPKKVLPVWRQTPPEWRDENQFGRCGEVCIKKKARALFSVSKVFISNMIGKLQAAYDDHLAKPKDKAKEKRLRDMVADNLKGFCPAGRDEIRCFKIYRDINREHSLPQMLKANAQMKKNIADLQDSRAPSVGSPVTGWQRRVIPEIVPPGLTPADRTKRSHTPEFLTAAEITRDRIRDSVALNQTIQIQQNAFIQDVSKDAYEPSMDEYILFEEISGPFGEKTTVPRKDCDGVVGCRCDVLPGYCIEKQLYDKDLLRHRQRKAAQAKSGDQISKHVGFLRAQIIPVKTTPPKKLPMPEKVFGKEAVEAYKEARHPFVERTIQIVRSHAIPTTNNVISFAGNGTRSPSRQQNPADVVSTGSVNPRLTRDLTAREVRSKRYRGKELLVPTTEPSQRQNEIGASLSVEGSYGLIEDIKNN